MKGKRILIAPLNWGLGHATRCIPIIRALRKMGAEVFLASDGRALELLRKEFPELLAFALPSYHIRYPSKHMVWHMAKQLPSIAIAVRAERKAVAKLVQAHKIECIISDNRFGCRHAKVTNIFISHQLHIRIPYRWLSFVVQKINQRYIRQFDACWVPDYQGKGNLGGQLSQTIIKGISLLYLGALTRMQRFEVEKRYDLIVVLSGPEPQRSIFEQQIIQQLSTSSLRALIVQGKTEEDQQEALSPNINRVSYLTASQLNEAILASEILLTRSGYSTIMDLAVLGRKAILVPTPGQTEQEYLAELYQQQSGYYVADQENLDISKAIAILNAQAAPIPREVSPLEEVLSRFFTNNI